MELHTRNFSLSTISLIILFSFGRFSYPQGINSEEYYCPNPEVAFSDTLPQTDTTIYQDEETAPQDVKPVLLPANLSLGEKLLWGEKGFFRITGIAPLTPEARKLELSVRRTMLTSHMIGGFLTAASMITTCYYGQRIIDGKRDLVNEKNAFVRSTIVLYAATGLLALLSPPPMIKRDDETSTISIHKYLAWAHVAGMILTPIIANGIRERVRGTRNTIWNMDKAHFHQAAGYITTALLTAAMITVTF